MPYNFVVVETFLFILDNLQTITSVLPLYSAGRLCSHSLIIQVIIPLSLRIHQFFTDFSMVAPSIMTAIHLHAHFLPVYVYTFNHHSANTDPQWWGSFHSVELNYLFGSPFTGIKVRKVFMFTIYIKSNRFL